MAVKNAVAKAWSLATSGDGLRHSDYPAGNYTAPQFNLANIPAVWQWNFPYALFSPIIPSVPATGTTYYVAKTGNDSNAGTLASPFLTIGKAVSVVPAGGTVLIKGGLYRERVRGVGSSMPNTGSVGNVITIGSFGDGEVIVDGSPATTWTRVAGGNVWTAPWSPATVAPACVVINNVPLREVRHGQAPAPFPAGEGISTVTASSGKWYYDAPNKLIYADFQSVIGAGDANAADVIVPASDKYETDMFMTMYFYQKNYVKVKGLTVRGSCWNGLSGYMNNSTFENCNVVFNANSGIVYQATAGYNTGNTAIKNHVYHNVLTNWPRGNNSFTYTGGGWGGGLSFASQMSGIARGNTVHCNGGEGVCYYGNYAANAGGYGLVEQNISVQNWSVNLYNDNTPFVTVRNNLAVFYPLSDADYHYAGAYPYDNQDKYHVNLSIADEYGSTDNTVLHHCTLTDARVYNNILIGGRSGIVEFGDGGEAYTYHSLINAVIANNTIICASTAARGTYTNGIGLSDSTLSGSERNSNSIVKNNLIIGYAGEYVISDNHAGPLTAGITIDYNLHFTTNVTDPYLLAGVSKASFAAWKSATSADTNSVNGDPLLVDGTAFTGGSGAAYDYTKAALQGGSPAAAAGADLSSVFTTNFAGATRTSWNIGAL